MVLLHGTLDVIVHEAQYLPTSLSTRVGSLVKHALCCGYGPALVGSLDPYVCLDVGTTRRLRSSVVRASRHPRWNERCQVLLADEADSLRFQVKV
jgi:hypothetical protein